MSRRRYPILGRPKLRLIDASITPLKPVYRESEILRGRSRDQSRASPGPVSGLDSGPDSGPDSGDPGPDPGPDPGNQYKPC